MKKLNNKGFTLIELLAVITIMGILMLVAIPAVSRTIENARRDTFQDVAKEYINAVRNGMLADNISCYDEETFGTVGANGEVTGRDEPKRASALLAGTYYFPLCSSESVHEDCTATIKSNTEDLMESGGKSPFGNADLVGYVKLELKDDGDKGYTKSTYSILLADSGSHGFEEELGEKSIKRSLVLLKGATKQVIPTMPEGEKAYPCELN